MKLTIRNAPKALLMPMQEVFDDLVKYFGLETHDEHVVVVFHNRRMEFLGEAFSAEGFRIINIRKCQNEEGFVHDCDKHLSNNQQIIKTFIHEMVHVKQMIHGYFEIVNGGYNYKQKFYKFSGYGKGPWEKEARHFENKLFKKYRYIV